MTKFIFVAGGVMSSIGKGIAVASIGKILQSKGFKVSAIKIDPYINVDAGTMNPIEHGEVFVTDDGTECDQDIGNYERFLDFNLGKRNYITTGSVYQSVIERERNLEYGGRCVEVVPDIPNEVIARIKRAAKIDKADFVIIEIGGTVGEYQNLLFLEAARILKIQSPKNVLFILVSYLPVPRLVGEMKTKPTQYAVRSLNMAGIQPDIILARAIFPIDEPRRRKLSIFCNVLKENIISAPDVNSIYAIPINFEKENLGNKILKLFAMPLKPSHLKNWNKLARIVRNVKKPVRIGIVGKYFKTGKFTLTDSYISVIEAIKHAAWEQGRKPHIFWLDSEIYDPVKLPDGNNGARKNLKKDLSNLDGVIVPGGFGSRGVEGKIKAIEFCRKNKIPYFGLCLGMQLAVIEFARHETRLRKANSAEFLTNCQENVIDMMAEQKTLMENKQYGGTMRLGKYKCKIKQGTISHRAYGKPLITERHRHRYELNNAFKEILEGKGMVVAGTNPERDLVEIVELKNHPFFVGTQFHPEFKSRPLNPHPLFREFIKACLKEH